MENGERGEPGRILGVTSAKQHHAFYLTYHRPLTSKTENWKGVRSHWFALVRIGPTHFWEVDRTMNHDIVFRDIPSPLWTFDEWRVRHQR